MLIKLFTLSFNPVLETFDDEYVQNFIKDKQVISLDHYFFNQNNQAYLLIVLQYTPVNESVAYQEKQLKQKKPADDSWKDLLKKTDWPLYNYLRDWRSNNAKKQGIPPYLIATNLQLATMIADKPSSVNDLLQIKGFGASKAEKFGAAILQILQQEILLQPDDNEPSEQN